MKTLTRFLPVLAVVTLVASVAVATPPIETMAKVFKAGLVIGTDGTALTKHYSKTATVDIASVNAVTCLDTTLSAAVTGAAVGDGCSLGTPASPTGNIGFTCYVSAA